MIFSNNKQRLVRVIKFNTDRSIQITKAPIEKSIIVLDKEGFLTKNSAFTEFLPSKFYGFIRPKILKIQGCFIVRENDPAPLEFRAENIYGKEVNVDQLEYHENESFSRAVSNVEENNSDIMQLLLSKGVLLAFGTLGIGIVILVVAGVLKTW